MRTALAYRAIAGHEPILSGAPKVSCADGSSGHESASTRCRLKSHEEEGHDCVGAPNRDCGRAVQRLSPWDAIPLPRPAADSARMFPALPQRPARRLECSGAAEGSSFCEELQKLPRI